MSGLRWGILATGWIADLFTSDLVANGFDVVAVGSRSADKAQHFAKRHGIAKAHGSYEALAADPDVDVIYIATPHPQHVDTALLCINNGKHVLVEKPCTLNAGEAELLKAHSRQHGVMIMEAMWTRFLPHMVRLREIIKTGRLGAVRNVLATHMQDLPDHPLHRLNSLELGGGALLDLGVYPISLAFDILGRPDNILSTGRHKETGADAQISAIFTYANGASAMMIAGSDAAGANRAEINCEEGYIEIDGIWYQPARMTVYDSQNKVIETFEQQGIVGRGMHYQAIELERIVASGKTDSAIMPIEETIAVMTALDSIRRQLGVVYPQERISSQPRCVPTS